MADYVDFVCPMIYPSHYPGKLPEPNPNPPLKSALLEDIRKREMVKVGLENRFTAAIRKNIPSISKPVGT